ncbi:hypothetical protein P3S67_008481 [Capsicum chacoense]
MVFRCIKAPAKDRTTRDYRTQLYFEFCKMFYPFIPEIPFELYLIITEQIWKPGEKILQISVKTIEFGLREAMIAEDEPQRGKAHEELCDSVQQSLGYKLLVCSPFNLYLPLKDFRS